MAGREGIREIIKGLREELKKTTDEKRREEIKQRIDDLRTGRVMMVCCALPREAFITARKRKPKKD